MLFFQTWFTHLLSWLQQSRLLSLTDLPKVDSVLQGLSGHRVTRQQLLIYRENRTLLAPRMPAFKEEIAALGPWEPGNGVSCWQEVCFRTESDGHTDGQTGCLSRDQSRELECSLAQRRQIDGMCKVAGEVTAKLWSLCKSGLCVSTSNTSPRIHWEVWITCS